MNCDPQMRADKNKYETICTLMYSYSQIIEPQVPNGANASLIVSPLMFAAQISDNSKHHCAKRMHATSGPWYTYAMMAKRRYSESSKKTRVLSKGGWSIEHLRNLWHLAQNIDTPSIWKCRAGLICRFLAMHCLSDRGHEFGLSYFYNLVWDCRIIRHKILTLSKTLY